MKQSHVSAKITKDGREIVAYREYRRRVALMHERDNGRCCLCGKPVPLEFATFEHKGGRGMGGGKRDDRIDGNGVSHFVCNYQKGSMSFEKWKETHPEAF